MTDRASKFRAFVRTYFSMLSPEHRSRVLRFTNAEYLAHVRWMHAKVAAMGPGLFCECDTRLHKIGGRSGPRASAQQVAVEERPGCRYARSFSHPSMGGSPLVAKVAESAGEEERRQAEALIVGSIRVCACGSSLDTVAVATAALRNADEFWRALLVLSAGGAQSIPRPSCRNSTRSTPGCVDPQAVWIPGCADPQAVWIPGCVDPRLCGSQALWIPGCLRRAPLRHAPSNTAPHSIPSRHFSC